MSPAALERALIDLGWVSLIHRALGGRPAESYALRQLLRKAGQPVSLQALAVDYHEHEETGGSLRPSKGRRLTGSESAVRKRIERLRAGLADLGVADVIQTLTGEKAYILQRRDVGRVEAAILWANGVEVEANEAA